MDSKDGNYVVQRSSGADVIRGTGLAIMKIRPRGARILLWFAVALATLALILAAFPWGLVACHAEGPLSKVVGRPVTIGDARRVGWLSFVPTIELQNVRIAQPEWAGPGDMIAVRAVRLDVPLLSLIFGQFKPRTIIVAGLDAHLVRDRDGRENWASGEPGSGQGRGPQLVDLQIDAGHVRLDDAKRGVALDAAVSVGAAHGVRINGAGTLRGAPLQIAVRAPAIVSYDAAKPYLAHLFVSSPLATLRGELTMEHPLDTNHFVGRFTASGKDLGYLDDIIQAGLFKTQPFMLSGQVSHDGLDWHIQRLNAALPHTRLTAKIDVTKGGVRTRLDGQINADRLDFGDFASNDQKARLAADQRRIGPRVVPATRIVLNQLRFDGKLDVHFAHLVASKSSPFLSLDTVAELKDRVLTLAPLMVGLPSGQLAGRVVVDSREETPRLTADVRVRNSTVSSFFPDQQVVAGPLVAHLRVTGSGSTVRDALASGSGMLGVAISGGTMRRDYATFLGGDVIKSVGVATGGNGTRTTLDCLIARFDVAHGRMTPQPLLLSTPAARGDGNGLIFLGPESIDMQIRGRPTKPGPLVSTAPVRLFGTLTNPRIDIRPPRAKNEEHDSLLSRAGFFIKKLRVKGSDDVEAAAPVNCAAETRRALR